MCQRLTIIEAAQQNVPLRLQWVPLKRVNLVLYAHYWQTVNHYQKYMQHQDISFKLKRLVFGKYY